MAAIILTLVIAMAVSSNVSASPNYGKGVYGSLNYGRNLYDRVMLHAGLDYHRYKVSSHLDQCTKYLNVMEISTLLNILKV